MAGYVCFLERDGLVARFFLPEHCSLTGILYKDQILCCIIQHYVMTHPRTGVHGIQVLHDNASNHLSAVFLASLL